MHLNETYCFFFHKCKFALIKSITFNFHMNLFDSFMYHNTNPNIVVVTVDIVPNQVNKARLQHTRDVKVKAISASIPIPFLYVDSIFYVMLYWEFRIQLNLDYMYLLCISFEMVKMRTLLLLSWVQELRNTIQSNIALHTIIPPPSRTYENVCIYIYICVYIYSIIY